MYFLPKNNWAYATLVTLKPLQRWLITCLLVIGIAYGWFFGIYASGAHALDRYAASINQYAQLHARAQKSVESTKRLESSLNIAQHTLHEYHKHGSGSPSDALQATMALIFDTAQRSGIALDTYSISKESQQELYMNHHIELDCTGSLDAIIQMLDTLHTHHVIITCDQVALRKVSQNRFSVRMACVLSVLIEPNHEH